VKSVDTSRGTIDRWTENSRLGLCMRGIHRMRERMKIEEKKIHQVSGWATRGGHHIPVVHPPTLDIRLALVGKQFHSPFVCETIRMGGARGEEGHLKSRRQPDHKGALWTAVDGSKADWLRGPLAGMDKGRGYGGSVRCNHGCCGSERKERGCGCVGLL
jgi:hypothetical protein